MRVSKNNFKNIVFLILLNTIFLDTAFYAQSPFDWPVDVDPLTLKGKVNGNIAEYTGAGSPRIHKGLDLVGFNASPKVFALEDGEITKIIGGSYSPYINVKSTSTGKTTRYIHVVPISTFNVVGVKISKGQYFAEMIDLGGADHLHLEYNIDISASDYNNAISHNILRDIGSQNTRITDNSTPIFETSHLSKGVAFYPNGLLKTQTKSELSTLISNRTLLYGKLDVAAHVRDYRIDFNGNIPASSGQLAPYALGFEIRNSNNQQIIENNSDNFRYSYDFDISPKNDNAKYLFHPLSAHPGSPSIHIITCNAESAGVVDRYWNTRLKRSTTQEWPQKGSTGYSSQNASRNN